MNTDYIFIFFLFSFGGWLIELVFRSICEKRLVNPGFHMGPWLPIYGLTGLVIVLVSGSVSQHSFFLKLMFYFLLSSMVEFAAGIFLDKVFNKKYWDYSANKFNLSGYICLFYSCWWVVICIIFDYLFLDRLFLLIKMIPQIFLFRLEIVLLLIFSVDFLSSSGIFTGVLKKLAKKVISYIENNWKHG